MTTALCNRGIPSERGLLWPRRRPITRDRRNALTTAWLKARRMEPEGETPEGEKLYSIMPHPPPPQGKNLTLHVLAKVSTTPDSWPLSPEPADIHSSMNLTSLPKPSATCPAVFPSLSFTLTLAQLPKTAQQPSINWRASNGERSGRSLDGRGNSENHHPLQSRRLK